MENWRTFVNEEKSSDLSKVEKALRDEGGAAGLAAIKKHTELSAAEVKDIVSSASNIKIHTNGDYILMDKSLSEEKNEKGKEKGADGKACWDGYKHAGTEGGKDKCVKMEEKKGLWDNIHAKRARGESPAKPGDEDYPETLNVDESLIDRMIREEIEAMLDEKKKKKKKKKKGKKSPAWQRKAGKNKEGGLNKKGRESYEKENPGSDLKAPTKKKGRKRRKSFCARMKGMKKKNTSAKTAKDPDSRINKSLRKWDC